MRFGLKIGERNIPWSSITSSIDIAIGGCPILIHSHYDHLLSIVDHLRWQILQKNNIYIYNEMKDLYNNQIL